MENDIIAMRVYVDDILINTAETIDWGLRSLGVPELWRQTQGEKIKVAILDSGIDNNHPDLFDAIEDEKDFTGSPVGPFDRFGHGTHVAGIVAARMNRFGVVGLAPKVKILNGKVLSDNGSGRSGDVVNGIKWAIDKKADIICMSLGTPYASEALREAVVAAAGKNIIPIAAAGNYGLSYYYDTINYPAKYDAVISVGSVDRNSHRSSYAAAGRSLDIMAPGEEVYSCYPMGMYAKLSGTSMATPFVAGVVALCLAKHRSLLESKTPCGNVIEVRDHLQRSGTDLGETGQDRYFGYGLINPAAFLTE